MRRLQSKFALVNTPLHFFAALQKAFFGFRVFKSLHNRASAQAGLFLLCFTTTTVSAKLQTSLESIRYVRVRYVILYTQTHFIRIYTNVASSINQITFSLNLNETITKGPSSSKQVYKCGRNRVTDTKKNTSNYGPPPFLLTTRIRNDTHFLYTCFLMPVFIPNNKESRYIKSVHRGSFFTSTKSTVKNNSRVQRTRREAERTWQFNNNPGRSDPCNTKYLENIIQVKRYFRRVVNCDCPIYCGP